MPKPKGKPRGKGRPFTSVDPRRNPGGKAAEEARAQRELREALALEWPAIHAALMVLVKSGNAPAIIYAHKCLAGEHWQGEEADDSDAPKAVDPRLLSTEQLRALDELDAIAERKPQPTDDVH